MAIIAAAGFLSFSAALHAACTAQAGYIEIIGETIIDMGKLNVPDDAPVGTPLAVINREVQESGRYWNCPSANDTLVFENGQAGTYVRPGLNVTLRMKLGNGNSWYRGGEVLFRGPGQYKVPQQTYEISYYKTAEISSGMTTKMGLARIKSGNSGNSSSYETYVSVNPFLVVGKTCTISPTSQTVTLTAKAPGVNATGFGPYSHFNFQLSNCPVGISEVKATMTGMPHGADPTVFANGGTAQGIGIEISNSTTGGILVPNANGATKWVTDAPARGNYAFRARVKKAGNVKAGTISAVTQIRFDYN